MDEPWKKCLKQDATDWLLAGNPWTRYRTLTDLLDKPASDPEVVSAKKDLLADERVRDLLAVTAKWFPVKPKRHDDATMSHYKLRMLADFGLTVSCEAICSRWSDSSNNEKTSKASRPAIGHPTPSFLRWPLTKNR